MIVAGDSSRRVTVDLPQTYRGLVEKCLDAFDLKEPVRLVVNGKTIASPSNHAMLRDGDVVVAVDALGRSVDLTTYAEDFVPKPISQRKPIYRSLADHVGDLNAHEKFSGISEYEERFKRWEIDRTPPASPRQRLTPSPFVRDDTPTPKSRHREDFVEHPAERRVAPSPDLRSFSHRELFTPSNERDMATVSQTDYAAPPPGSLAAATVNRRDHHFIPTQGHTGRTESQDSYVAYADARPPTPATPPQREDDEIRHLKFTGETEYQKRYQPWPLEERVCGTPPTSSFQRQSDLPFTARTTNQDDFAPPPQTSPPSRRIRNLASYSPSNLVAEDRTFKTASADFRSPPPNFVARADVDALRRARVHLEPALEVSYTSPK